MSAGGARPGTTRARGTADGHASRTVPELAYDPADMPAAAEAGPPAGGSQLPRPDFELDRVEIDPDTLHTLPAVLAEFTSAPGPLPLVQDATPVRRDGQDLKALVRRLLTEAGWQVRTVTLQADEDGQADADEHASSRSPANCGRGAGRLGRVGHGHRRRRTPSLLPARSRRCRPRRSRADRDRPRYGDQARHPADAAKKLPPNLNVAVTVDADRFTEHCTSPIIGEG